MGLKQHPVSWRQPRRVVLDDRQEAIEVAKHQTSRVPMYCLSFYSVYPMNISTTTLTLKKLQIKRMEGGMMRVISDEVVRCNTIGSRL